MHIFAVATFEGVRVVSSQTECKLQFTWSVQAGLYNSSLDF